MNLERAVSFSLLARTWQAGAGLATIPFVVHYLGATKQGYYYTFSSLIALQSFFELGFSIVISVYASHEWHRLHVTKQGRISGDQRALSRLTSLGRFVITYSAAMSVAYAAIVSAVGYYILSSGPSVSFNWQLPWLIHILLSAVQLSCVPFLSILEGCGQMVTVAKFKLYQSVLASAVFWAGLAGGLELWAVPALSLTSVLALIVFLGWRRRRFFSTFLVAPSGDRLSWKQDLLPMQWRLAVQGLFSYMSFPLYTSLAYVYLGAVEAGRLGMTLQIVGGVQAFALVFLSARAPQFSLLAAESNLSELKRRCIQATAQTILAMFGFCAVLATALALAKGYGVEQADRVLPFFVFAIFSIGIACTGVVQGIALYLRAQKKELLTAVGVTAGCLYGLSGWQACLHFGSGGIAASYALVTALFVIPLSLVVLRSQLKLQEGAN